MATELHRLILLLPNANEPTSYYIGVIDGRMRVTQNKDKALEVTKVEGENIMQSLWEQIQIKSSLEPCQRECEDNLRLLLDDKVNYRKIRIYKVKTRHYLYLLDDCPIEQAKRVISYKRALATAQIIARGV